MGISALVLSAVSYLAGSIAKGSVAKTARDEFSEALWNWVRPIFIKDDEPLKDLESSPQNSINQTDVALKIEKHLNKNPEKINELKVLIEKLEKNKSNKENVKVSQIHYGSGDNIAGDKIVK